MPAHYFSDKMDPLKSKLACSVCFLVPKCKIFNCVNGHSICETCFSKLQSGPGGKKCPLSCNYDETPRRNRYLESIIIKSDLLLSCCCMPLCQVQLRKDALEEHEKKCDYRGVPCPHTGCEKIVCYNDLEYHLVEYHIKVIKKRQNYSFTTGL